MLFFLQLIGGLVLSALLLAVLVYLYFKWKFGKFLDFDSTVSSSEPLHIHLNEEIEPDWHNDKPVKAAITELEGLGFERGKSYQIHEMDGVSLLVFHKPPLVSVLYTHSIAGNWVDIVADEIDGKEYTFSNAPMGRHLENRPETVKEFNPQATISEVYERAERFTNSVGDNFVDITAENFREYFELAYKKDMAFKVRKGGVSFEEFVALSDDAPFNSSDKVIEEGFTDYKEQELDQWHEAALEEYRVAEGIDEEAFYDIEHALLIVPFKSHSPAFVQYLLGQCFIVDKQEDQLMKLAEKVEDVNELFDQINDMLSPELRATFVTDIKYPLPIRLFKMSKKMMDRY
jgi:hypothetical protein